MFDQAALAARLLHDGELIRTVVAGFLDDMPRQMAVLQQCVATGDPSGAARHAHTIKGACNSVGGLRMAAVASRIEQAVRETRLDAAVVLTKTLHAEYAELQQAMESSCMPLSSNP